ncbi:nuclear transport factor 2 family protein [Rhizobacter sp. LjRoot28]|uniref:nuclear transport factor 2 family protein n=1 Tax=Rhizobacter sp. LjRoot28 TaxID=3342309 RepID=UPI003ECE2213
MNQAVDTKALMRAAFDALAQGDGAPFVALMAEDFTWTIPGESTWSGQWRGKRAVREELFKPLFARFAGTYTNRARRILQDGDVVVVECEGAVATRAGGRYDNRYCYVCRFEGGLMKELTEYMDTELAARALGAPPRPAA